MKKICFQFFILLLLLSGCKTSKLITGKSQPGDTRVIPVADNAPKAIDFHDQTTWILGKHPA